MSPTPLPTGPGQAFAQVRAALAAMDHAAGSNPVDLMALAKAYAQLARAMVAAATAAGQTSRRFDAVDKALDLRTSKSALERFLADR